MLRPLQPTKNPERFSVSPEGFPAACRKQSWFTRFPLQQGEHLTRDSGSLLPPPTHSIRPNLIAQHGTPGFPRYALYRETPQPTPCIAQRSFEAIWINSTPVSVTDRQTTLHGRNERPPSNVKPKSAGKSTVFAICTRAPLLVTFRTAQSITDALPRTIFAPLKTRERVNLRRSCILSCPAFVRRKTNNWRRLAKI